MLFSLATDFAPFFEVLPLYLLLGIVAGMLSGLLGVGGGVVVVPMVSYALELQGIMSEHNFFLALGTSLATILFSSFSSARAHNKRGNVLWSLVKQIVPGILLGTFLGSILVSKSSPYALRVLFVVFLLYVGTQMLLDIRPKARETRAPFWAHALAGFCIGAFSSAVGIGGGTLSIPYLLWRNVPMREAIGSSAAIGFPIALAGTIGYIVSGLQVADVPAASLGFVYLPALFGIGSMSLFFAPLGAKLAYKVSVPTLKRIFAFLLYLMSLRMLYALV